MRRLDPFDRKAMLLSMGLHAALIVGAWLSMRFRPEPMEFETIAIELVSPPAELRAEDRRPATAERVVERPEPEPEPDVVPEPPPPEPDPEPAPPEPEPEPEPEPPSPEPEQREAEPTPDPDVEPTPSTSPNAPEEPQRTSGQDMNVRIEGLRRDFPAYYENITYQIIRCFRPPASGLETEVVFTIGRNGSASALDYVSRSGNYAFDVAAMGAVECAGARFGPLPAGFQYEAVRISFKFSPSREQ